jgi:hypothetical protein
VASAELRRIQRRIRSVRSTMKITRAMELIATSRIARAQQRVTAAQPYIQKMNEVIRNVAAVRRRHHPLLRCARCGMSSWPSPDRGWLAPVGNVLRSLSCASSHDSLQRH